MARRLASRAAAGPQFTQLGGVPEPSLGQPAGFSTFVTFTVWVADAGGLLVGAELTACTWNESGVVALGVSFTVVSPYANFTVVGYVAVVLMIWR